MAFYKGTAPSIIKVYIIVKLLNEGDFGVLKVYFIQRNPWLGHVSIM